MKANISLSERVLRVVFGRPPNFSFVDDYASGSALPTTKREIAWLGKIGISAILSLTETPLNQKWIRNFEYRNVPMKDHSIPTLDQLSQAVSFLIQQTREERKVLVHCLAGKGRTGTVLAAYLCQKYGLTPSDAIASLRLKRPGSVETKQVPILNDFYQNML